MRAKFYPSHAFEASQFFNQGILPITNTLIIFCGCMVRGIKKTLLCEILTLIQLFFVTTERHNFFVSDAFRGKEKSCSSSICLRSPCSLSNKSYAPGISVKWNISLLTMYDCKTLFKTRIKQGTYFICVMTGILHVFVWELESEY